MWFIGHQAPPRGPKRSMVMCQARKRRSPRARAYKTIDSTLLWMRIRISSGWKSCPKITPLRRIMSLTSGLKQTANWATYLKTRTSTTRISKIDMDQWTRTTILTRTRTCWYSLRAWSSKQCSRRMKWMRPLPWTSSQWNRPLRRPLSFLTPRSRRPSSRRSRRGPSATRARRSCRQSSISNYSGPSLAMMHSISLSWSIKRSLHNPSRTLIISSRGTWVRKTNSWIQASRTFQCGMLMKSPSCQLRARDLTVAPVKSLRTSKFVRGL